MSWWPQRPPVVITLLTNVHSKRVTILAGNRMHPEHIWILRCTVKLGGRIGLAILHNIVTARVGLHSKTQQGSECRKENLLCRPQFASAENPFKLRIRVEKLQQRPTCRLDNDGGRPERPVHEPVLAAIKPFKKRPPKFDFLVSGGGGADPCGWRLALGRVTQQTDLRTTVQE